MNIKLILEVAGFVAAMLILLFIDDIKEYSTVNDQITDSVTQQNN